MCHCGRVSTRHEGRFLKITCFYVPTDKEEKTAAKSFQAILVFYNGNMKHWLSLISLKAFQEKQSFLFSSEHKSFLPQRTTSLQTRTV